MGYKAKIYICLFALAFAFLSLLCLHTASTQIHSTMHHAMPQPISTACVNIHGLLLQTSQSLNTIEIFKVLFFLVLFAVLFEIVNREIQTSFVFYKFADFLKQRYLANKKFVSWLALFELRDFSV